MGVVPMKHDEDFFEHNSKATEVAAVGLREFVSALEGVAEQQADLSREKADIYTVAKSKGWNVKALRKLVAERRRDAADLREEQDAMAMYRDLLL